jgi:ABC-type multidrug transport system ATPase subunit
VMRDERRLIVFSSHDFESVERICDRVLVLEGGKLIADTTPDTFRGESSLRERLAAQVPS